jgi:hypothetical protein
MAILVTVRFGLPYGMMEYWRIGILGMKIGKRPIIRKMLNLTIFVLISFFKPIIPLLQNPWFHYSSIQTF